MKKKLYLRIRVLVLILLLILSSLIIAPEQVLADTEVVADEETPEVTSAEEAIPAAIETEIDSAESPSEPELDSVKETEASAPDEATNETDDVTSEATTLPTTESTSADDSQSTEHNAEGTDDTDTDTLPTVESPEAEQTLEEAVSDKQDKEDADTSVSDPAEYSKGAKYSPEEDFVFDPGTGTIVSYKGTSKVVDIPPSIGNVPVYIIGREAFYEHQLIDVTIPYGIEIINEGAFEMNELTDIVIPDSVIYIGQWAFARNQLTGVTISNNVTKIEYGTFEKNNLTDVTIPDSVIKIASWAFADNQLKNVKISDQVTLIDSNAFSLNQLTSVTIPDSVMQIGIDAFYHNKLTSITIPSNIVSIGEGAFTQNPISQATIPNSISCITFDLDEDLVQPTIEQIGYYCFDDGVQLIAKRYIKANYYIRETPNGKVITKLWRPLYVTGTSTSTGAWLKFTYNGNPAYVIMEATTNTPPEITGYATGILNLRDQPGGSIIGTIPIGRQVNGQLVKDMVKTTYNGKTGYVYASLLQKDPVQVTRYIKAGSNIRKTPGGTIIETLKMPIFVSGIITGNYLRFTYKGQPAYVPMSLTTTQNPPITGYAKQKINVRSSPNGSVIGSLTIGRKVSGTLVGNWVRFTYAGKTGYVYSSLLQADPVNLTCYVKAGSNIRSSPGGTIIATLKMPIYVSGTIQGSCLKFTYKGKTAYVGISLITTNPPPITGYTKSAVNVRSSPGGSVIGTLPANRKVSGTLVGNWVKFTYSGKTGYINASLLK
ncbi:MAG: leucine-rich repeat protein [Saccharofermentanales bacterium]